MTTGSEYQSNHIIDEVIFDCACDTGNTIDEARLAAWVVDELLPALEAVLDSYDDAATVFRIENITVDLGDIDSADYWAQMLQRFLEQFDEALNKIIRNRQPVKASVQFAVNQTSIRQSDVSQTVEQQSSSNIHDPAVQPLSLLKSRLEILRYYLSTGNMPWHVKITESMIHEKLVDQILQEANGAKALNALLTEMVTTHRDVLASRLMSQFSTEYRIRLLQTVVYDQSNHWPDLTESIQRALAETALSEEQAWFRLFGWALNDTGRKHEPEAYRRENRDNPLVVFQQVLNKTAVKSSNHEKRLQSDISRDEAGDIKTPANSHDKHTNKTETVKPSAYTAFLFNRFISLLRKSGIGGKGLTIINPLSAESATVQRRIFNALQDAAWRHRLANKVPDDAIIDLMFIVSPPVAAILEQLLLHSESMYPSNANDSTRNHVVWKKAIRERALQYLVVLQSGQPTNISADVFEMMQSVADGLPIYIDADGSGHMCDENRLATLMAENPNKSDKPGLAIVANLLSDRARSFPIQQNVLQSETGQAVTFEKPMPGKNAIEALTGKAAVQPENKPQQLHGNAVVFRRVLVALEQAGWDCSGISLTEWTDDNPIRIRNQLLEIMLRQSEHMEWLAGLPISRLKDIVSLLSPGNASILETLWRAADSVTVQTTPVHDADTSTPVEMEHLLYRETLNALVSAFRLTQEIQNQNIDNHPGNSFAAFVEMPSLIKTVVRRLSDTPEGMMFIQRWREYLENKSVPGPMPIPALQTLKHVLLESGLFLTQPLGSNDVDSTQTNKATPGSVHGLSIPQSNENTKDQIRVLLEKNSERAHDRRDEFFTAIESYAEKADNQTAYYREILEKLMFDQDIDLETISKQTHEPVEPYSTKLYRQVLSAMKIAAFDGKDRFNDEPSLFYVITDNTDAETIRNHLRRVLYDKTLLEHLISQLSQPVLLDIVYLLSPQAALLLEQVLSVVDALEKEGKDKSGTDQLMSLSATTRQIMRDVLDYLVKIPSNETKSILDTDYFIRRLVRLLTADPVLQKSIQQSLPELSALPTVLIEVLMQEESERLENQKSSYGAEVSPDRKIPSLLSAMAVQDKPRQYLNLKIDSGDFAPDQYTAQELKIIVFALLMHEQQKDNQTFIDAIETYAQTARQEAVFYRQILEKLLSDQIIDLEAIAKESERSKPSRNQTESDFQNAESVKESEVSKKPNAADNDAPESVIVQRIQAAIEKCDFETDSVELDLLLDTALAHDPDSARHQLADCFRDLSLRKQLIAGLPSAILLDIAYLLSPSAASILERLQTQADNLFRLTDGHEQGDVTRWKCELWDAALGFLVSLPVAGSLNGLFDLIDFLSAIIQRLTNNKNTDSVIQLWHDAFERIPGMRVLRHLLQIMKNRPEHVMRDDLMFDEYLSSDGLECDTILGSEFESIAEEEFFVDNAGQVLTAPYLPRLFTMLGLIKDGIFINRSAAERAVHLLQFMVNEQFASPEYQLLLNKIICGLATGIPVRSRIDPSQHERDTIDDLIRGMIQNWKTIGNTSIAGLRETFLQRRGKLVLKEDIWFLTIEPGPFDMLLDQLPWSFSVIKHHWMERAIHVTWR